MSRNENDLLRPRERWMRREIYGGVWHRCDFRDLPICGTNFTKSSGHEFEFCDEVPYTKHVSYICLRCYRIERGLEAPLQQSLVFENRIEALEISVRAMIQAWEKPGRLKARLMGSKNVGKGGRT